MVRSRRRAFSSKICARRGFKKKTGNSAQGACSPRYAIIRSAFSTVARTLSQSMVGLINQVRQRTQGAVQRLVAHIPKIDWLRNREDVDANPIKSWDGLGQIKLIPKPRVPSGLLLLPFDVMGPGILSFLAPLDMGAFRQSSHAGQRAVDMYAEIRTHHMILGNQARRIIIGNILTTRQEYVPDGSNYSPYLLYRFIQIFGDLMTAKEWPVDPGYMQRLQCRESLGDTDFLEESTRTCLADWLLEVASEYAYPYSVWHDAVLRLDTYLSKRPTRRLKLQLIGCACLLIETNRVGIQGLTVGDAFNLCDDKYSIEEIGQAVTMVAVDTETELSIGTTPILPSILDCAMCYFLCTSRITSPYVHMTVRHSCSHDVGDNGDEHHIIVLMLADLAAMDCDFLKFSPFTTAAAIAYYASLVMHFYSQSNIFVSSASGSKFGYASCSFIRLIILLWFLPLICSVPLEGHMWFLGKLI